jgi:hypothetical protein
MFLSASPRRGLFVTVAVQETQLFAEFSEYGSRNVAVSLNIALLNALQHLFDAIFVAVP